jgi:hypothetical protein
MPEEDLINKEAAPISEIGHLLSDFVHSSRDAAALVMIHENAFNALRRLL